jgi:hypothetical protein
MIKRLLAILALSAAGMLAACSPSDGGGGTSPGLDSSPDAVESMPMESMPAESAAPSAS